MTAFNVLLIVLILLIIIVVVSQSHDCLKTIIRLDDAATKERERLLDRIQAPTLREYKAVVEPPKPRERKDPSEVITPL